MGSPKNSVVNALIRGKRPAIYSGLARLAHGVTVGSAAVVEVACEGALEFVFWLRSCTYARNLGKDSSVGARKSAAV